MVELDVQLTADRQLVIVHDDTLDRCSNVHELFPMRGDRRVQAFTLAEIRTLDAGSWFAREIDLEPSKRQAFLRSLTPEERHRFITDKDLTHYRDGTVRHPTLKECLVRASELGLGVNIELKYPTPDKSSQSTQRNNPEATQLLAESTVRVIEALGLNRQVLVSSFEHHSLVYVKELRPEIATGVLVSEPVADPVTYCKSLRGAGAYHPGASGRNDAVGFHSASYMDTGRLPPELFVTLRKADIDINVWTVNDPDQMKALIEAGASGIFTDYPNRLVELLSRDR